jgi:hypothetical protein
MAKKKRTVKRRKARKSARVSRRNSQNLSSRKKIWVVLNNLLLFVALSLISYVLTRFLTNAFLVDLFSVTAMVFGFVAAGFLITLVVLLILSALKKKR